MTKRERLRIALPNCAELELISDQFRACGFPVPDLSNPGLHLITDPFECGFDFEIFRLDPADVGTYVEHAISHIGVMSTDLLRETDAEVWRPLTFPFGKHPLILAAPRGESIVSLSARPQIRIATPFPNLTRDLFAHRGLTMEVLNVSDSATACLLGLADAFVDRLIDPNTLLDQDFRVVELLGHARLKLVVNRALGARRRIAVQDLISSLKANESGPPPEIDIPFDDEDEVVGRTIIGWDEDSSPEQV
ncbi:MAG: ATP phosphoribosyltransferase [Bradymonadaceae bacterium]